MPEALTRGGLTRGLESLVTGFSVPVGLSARAPAAGRDRDHGSGLTGLLDRIEAADGSLVITSPVGGGTTLRARLPLPPGRPSATAGSSSSG